MNNTEDIFIEFPKCECANAEDHLTGKGSYFMTVKKKKNTLK
jgi:hypothetical protein